MSAQKPLAWITESQKYQNLREVKGAQHNPTILGWLRDLDAWWSNDEVAWCGTYVAACLKKSGRGIPKHWYRALAYADYGTKLDKPCYGCIVVFSRQGGGHVGFVVGVDKYGNLMVQGGNQGDQVNIRPFSVGRVTAYIWPPTASGRAMSPDPSRYNLPVLTSDGRVSTNEA